MEPGEHKSWSRKPGDCRTREAKENIARMRAVSTGSNESIRFSKNLHNKAAGGDVRERERRQWAQTNLLESLAVTEIKETGLEASCMWLSGLRALQMNSRCI